VSRDLAIDLGTANTLVYARGQGIILNEPTVIALNSRTQEVLAMGHEAWHMIGRTPGHIVAVRPLRGGAITDFEVTQRLIRLIFARAGITRLQRSRVLVCVPSAISHVEQRAVLEATRRAGAAQTYLIEQPMAAAIGASLPIHEPLGNMIVDVGGGTSEMAVISLGGIISLQAVRVGGFDLDHAIQAFLRRNHGVAVGERTAEEIKLAIGSAFPTADEFKVEVRGRDLMSGLPRTIVLEPEEIREAIDEPVQAILDATKQALSETPPELAQDLLEMGIHLVGGGALLKGFDKRIEHETGVPVNLSDHALETVVLGAGRCLESFDRLREMFMDRPRGSTQRYGGN
jgi:rod shape-determining protein MreB